VAEDATESEILAAQIDTSESKSAESSLLSEFAVSDMGATRGDGEADPLAEADVYLAYGRYQQAEGLIKDALSRDAENEDLNLKLLEVFMAAGNPSAFDEHAQAILGRLENSDHPTWEKVAEMGREMSPENPMYQEGDAEAAASDDPMEDVASAEPEAEEDQGLDFDIDLSFDKDDEAASDQPASMEFTPPEPDADDEMPAVDMDSVEPDAVSQDDNALEFDIDALDLDATDEGEEEMQGDGELADLDEVSTKLDLARAYIDMGDPDGARSILDEVMDEGSDEQKDEARDIMTQLA